MLLGLLTTALRDKTGSLGSPAVLLTAVLFGFMHALTLDKALHISFDPVYFLHTGIGGYVFGWLTLKSRSLVLAMLTHGLANFFAALAMMIRQTRSDVENRCVAALRKATPCDLYKHIPTKKYL